MAATVTTRWEIDAVAVEQVSRDFGTATLRHRFPPDLAQPVKAATGTGDSQQDLCWSDQRSAAGSADALDLAGSLTSQLDGATLTFVEITAIWIRNRSTTSGEVLTVGAGSNPLLNWVNATGDAVKVGPSGLFVISSPVDGYGVTAGTGDVLTIDPGANTITYDIMIWGRSA